MNRVIFTTLGYVLFVIGFLSLTLGLIGLEIWPFYYLDADFNPLVTLLLKFLFLLGGFIIFYMNRTYHPEDEE